jgi:glycosyltransferase involved in cell wall biosynthesis
MLPERIVIGPVDTIDVLHFMVGADEVRRQANETRQRLGVPSDYFLAVSRFAPEKNLLNLVRAYGLYLRRMGKAAWKLVVVGDGPMMAAIQRSIEDSGLEDSVQLPGWVTFERLPAYYGLAGAFVHASTKDTWGVVVNEAMAAGLPVIVSNRCGSALELVHEGQNGFTFDPGNVAELSELLWKVAHSGRDRALMSLASRDIIQGWTPKKYAESLLAAANVAVNSPVIQFRLVDSALLVLLTHMQMKG